MIDELTRASTRSAESIHARSVTSNYYLSWFAIVIAVLTGSTVVGIESFGTTMFEIGSIKGEPLAAVVVGVSLVFSAVLLGYFLILREWIVSTSSLAADVAEAVREAADQMRKLERLELNTEVNTADALVRPNAN